MKLIKNIQLFMVIGTVGVFLVKFIAGVALFGDKTFAQASRFDEMWP